MIQAYVFGRNPKYRMLLKNKPEIFNEIPWVVDEEKLEMELFKPVSYTHLDVYKRQR